MILFCRSQLGVFRAHNWEENKTRIVPLLLADNEEAMKKTVSTPLISWQRAMCIGTI